MAWFRRRWTDQQVQEAIERAVKDALDKAALERKASDPLALGQALERLYATQVESFGKTAGVLSDFLQGAGELATHRYAIALGSRGGRKKAENQRARQAASQRRDVFDPNCDACNNPATTNSTAITRHVLENHAARKRAADAQTNLALEAPANGSANGAAAATRPLN
ncbi:MAG: hypothetical protein WA459_00210 [Stellaceae bacterium]